MQELFINISPERKKVISDAVEMTFFKKDPKLILDTFFSYQKNLNDEDEKNFAEFCFNLNIIKRKEALKNESHSN